MFRTASFSPEALQAGGLVVLPVQTESGAEIFRMPFEGSIDDAVRTECEETDSLFPAETILVLEERGLYSELETAMSEYAKSSVMDTAILGEIGRATGMRYLMFVTITRPKQPDIGLQQQYDPGVFSVRTQVEARVFDAATGDLVWQGTGASQVDDKKDVFFAFAGLNDRKSVEVRRSTSVFDAADGAADELARLLCKNVHSA